MPPDDMSNLGLPPPPCNGASSTRWSKSRCISTATAARTATWELVAATPQIGERVEQLCAAAAGRLLGGTRS